MIRFSIHLDPENNITRVKSFPEELETIFIGRDKDCHLKLRSNTVSRHHCRLEFYNNNYNVEDLASTQGTRLNGEKLVPRVSVPIHHGDILQVGDISMVIAILEEPETTEQLSDAAHQAVSNILGKFIQGPSSDTSAYLKILNGEDEGLKLLFTDKTSWLIGRQEDADFTIHDGTISRRHAKITLENGSYYLEDLDSTSGTAVNGVPITKRYHLVHLDRLLFGAIKVVFFDPSQELLSALEYVEQGNELSQTKALEVHEMATVPPSNDENKFNEKVNKPKEITASTTKKDPTFSATTDDDQITAPRVKDADLAAALGEATAKDLSDINLNREATVKIEPDDLEAEVEEAESASQKPQPVVPEAEALEAENTPRKPRPVAHEATVSARTLKPRHGERHSQRMAGNSEEASETQPEPPPLPRELVAPAAVEPEQTAPSRANRLKPQINHQAPTVVRKKRRRLPLLPIMVMFSCITLMLIALILFLLKGR